MKPVKDMTVPELLAYAEERHGIQYPKKMTKGELLAKLAELPGEEDLSLDPVGAGSATEGNEDRVAKTVTLNIPDDGSSALINYETVYLNGRSYQIQKGKDVTVPYGVYDILNNAIEDFLTPVRQPDGKVNYEVRQRRRIPFSVIKMNY